VKRRALKPLLFPAILLLVGLALGAGADFAVGRRQDYVLYGYVRPVADLAILIGVVWLAVAFIGGIVRRAMPRA